jgi:hypothetical protein
MLIGAVFRFLIFKPRRKTTRLAFFSHCFKISKVPVFEMASSDHGAQFTHKAGVELAGAAPWSLRGARAARFCCFNHRSFSFSIARLYHLGRIPETDLGVVGSYFSFVSHAPVFAFSFFLIFQNSTIHRLAADLRTEGKPDLAPAPPHNFFRDAMMDGVDQAVAPAASSTIIIDGGRRINTLQQEESSSSSVVSTTPRGGEVSSTRKLVDEDRRPSIVSSSPTTGSDDQQSELDQCGDDMLDTVDSVVNCVNQNHVELQHHYEETAYHVVSSTTTTDADDDRPCQHEQQDHCSSEETMLEAVQCGATEPMGDLMLLAAYSSLGSRYYQPHLQLPPAPPTTVRSSPIIACSSLYQCQDCATTKTLRQLQPDVRETIWWPCDQCQKDCRWNPATSTTAPDDNWGDGSAAAATAAHSEEGCVIQ